MKLPKFVDGTASLSLDWKGVGVPLAEPWESFVTTMTFLLPVAAKEVPVNEVVTQAAAEAFRHAEETARRAEGVVQMPHTPWPGIWDRIEDRLRASAIAQFRLAVDLAGAYGVSAEAPFGGMGPQARRIAAPSLLTLRVLYGQAPMGPTLDHLQKTVRAHSDEFATSMPCVTAFIEYVESLLPGGDTTFWEALQA